MVVVGHYAVPSGFAGSAGGSGGGGGTQSGAGGAGNTPSTSPSQGNPGGAAMAHTSPYTAGGGWWCRSNRNCWWTQWRTRW